MVATSGGAGTNKVANVIRKKRGGEKREVKVSTHGGRKDAQDQKWEILVTSQPNAPKNEKRSYRIESNARPR